MSIIGEKDSAGNITTNSLLRQDILRYNSEVLNSEKKAFAFSELMEWIVDHNKEIINYYGDLSTRNTTKRNRVASRWDRVKKRLDELMFLKLVREAGNKKTSRGNISPAYEFTDLGHMVSLVITYDNLKDEISKKKRIEHIYQLVCSYLSSNQSSSDKYSLSIFKQFWENNFFVTYLEAFAKSLGLDTAMFGQIDIASAKEADFEKMKHQALKQLSEDEKKLFLYGYKIIVESMFYRNARNLKGYEDIAFKCRGTANQLAVEGYCDNCKLCFHLAIITLNYFYIPSYHSTTTITCIKCEVPKCDDNSYILRS
jgi:hypothetical protein